MVFFCSLRLLGFTHSSLFQCIWNFQSFQSWLAFFSFLFISSSSFWVFFPNLFTFSGGSFWPNFFAYQPPPIACNDDLRFSFGLGYLGSSTGVSWNNLFILKAYILQRSMKFCYKAFRQQSMKSMVAPSKTNASVVEFYGSGKTPPMLPSSQDY